MASKIKRKLKKGSNRSFLAKDFESLRQDLIGHARVFFPDKVQDFSEPSLPGMLVDMIASVGDSLAFYLDHQFRELDPSLAVEPGNIINHLKNAGVEAFGAASSLVDLNFSITVPAQLVDTNYIPKKSALPVILQNTVLESQSGIMFTTFEDLDFTVEDADGNLVNPYTVSTLDNSGNPKEFTMVGTVVASSGQEVTENIVVANTHVPFREITLGQKDISVIRSVIDTSGEEYYEVKSLSQDTVFAPVANHESDNIEVRSNLEIMAAPRRYVKSVDPVTRLTTLKFGSGDVDVLDDDILPDPSDLSLELYGKKVVPRFSIDPNALLKTQTLGISPKGTTLSVTYRYGGGSNHNVSSNSISIVKDLRLEFRKSPSPKDALSVRRSVEVINPRAAAGAANAPDLETLRGLLVSARMSQNRMVTREDVLARIFTMPSTFGRVFRASVAENPVNPQATTLYIISRDRDNKLQTAPDSLKKNLSKYLNEFRLISDAYDILDAQIINFGVKYEVVTAKNANKQQVALNINNRLAELLQLKYFQIDQPVIIDDIAFAILEQDFVIALSDLRVFPITGLKENRQYSLSSFPFENSTKRGMIFGPKGSMFELKFPEHDIIGSAV